MVAPTPAWRVHLDTDAEELLRRMPVPGQTSRHSRARHRGPSPCLASNGRLVGTGLTTPPRVVLAVRDAPRNGPVDAPGRAPDPIVAGRETACAGPIRNATRGKAMDRI